MHWSCHAFYKKKDKCQSYIMQKNSEKTILRLELHLCDSSILSNYFVFQYVAQVNLSHLGNERGLAPTELFESPRSARDLT